MIQPEATAVNSNRDARNVLVTGVSRGVGLAIASALLEAGWNVYGVSRTRTSELEVLATRFEGRFHFREVDLAGCVDVRVEVFESLVPLSLPLHALVNNAAAAYDDIVTNLDVTRLRQMYELNVFVPMVLTKYAIRNMLLHRIRGSIVHVSSISAHTGYKGLAMYASTKGAVEAFSKNVAREWGGKGIRSNCVVPGFMDTAMSAALSEEQRSRIYQRTALKAPTSPECVAATVKFLLGEDALSITGQVYFVDSGTI